SCMEYARERAQGGIVGVCVTYRSNHHVILRLEQSAGIDLTYIPFTGTGPLPAALLGNHVSAVMNYTMLGVQMADDVRVLAVASEERVPSLPDAPTVRELGYDLVGGASRGV